MHRQPLLTLLRQHQPADANERAMTQATRTFVEAHPDCFERSLLIGHVTGSAWIVARDPTVQQPVRTALIHHRKLDRWLQPGGHADGGPDVAGVALREAQEETGLRSLEWVRNGVGEVPIFDVDVHRIPARPDVPEHWHYDIRFLLRADADEPFGFSDEVKQIAWFTLDEARHLTTDESMQRMIRKTMYDSVSVK